MSDYMTLISIMGTDERFITGRGSLKGCMSEAASIRKRLRSEDWTAMGPGDWQGENVLLCVMPYKQMIADNHAEWTSVAAFRERIKAAKRAHREGRDG